uniref:DUF4283 domain-containing protein n=1 Tax=Cannabis sativa TaxID=3483 RepID=A0A803QC32_CANSA
MLYFTDHYFPIHREAPAFVEQEIDEEKQGGLDVFEDAGSTDGLTLIAAVANSPEMDSREQEIDLSSRKQVVRKPQTGFDWAKVAEIEAEVEQEKYHESAKSQWSSFSKGNLFSRDSKLTYTEPLAKNGVKIARIDPDEVVKRAENWRSAVICMVLGANPPMAVFEGFIKRIWGHLGIVQVVHINMGPWSTDLNTVKLVRTVPFWIRLHDLGLQYWGNNIFSALVSTIRKLIMVDQHTKECTRVQFVRILVEMDSTDDAPRTIPYLNEHGQLVEQSVEYGWLPVKCKNCSGYGHIMGDDHKGGKEKKGKSSYQEAFYVTFVYEVNTMDERKDLWKDLLKIRFPAKPWLIPGNFNVGYYINDRT